MDFQKLEENFAFSFGTLYKIKGDLSGRKKTQKTT